MARRAHTQGNLRFSSEEDQTPVDNKNRMVSLILSPRSVKSTSICGLKVAIVKILGRVADKGSLLSQAVGIQYVTVS